MTGDQLTWDDIKKMDIQKSVDEQFAELEKLRSYFEGIVDARGKPQSPIEKEIDEFLDATKATFLQLFDNDMKLLRFVGIYKDVLCDIEMRLEAIEKHFSDLEKYR